MWNQPVLSSAPRATASRSLLDRLTTYTAPDDAEGHPIHGLHPYPAKYIPPLPREVIAEHVNERHVVLDPFCGSGTTLVEACLAGVRSIGVDSNPIACLASRAKTTPLSAGQLKRARAFRARVASADPRAISNDLWRPRVSSLDHWFRRNMQRELAWLLHNIRNVPDAALSTFLQCVLSSIITSVSNQDSETRYTAVVKSLDDGYALRRFTRRLDLAIEAASRWSADVGAMARLPAVLQLPVERLTSEHVPDASIDLIVTSPPYPNSFDYYLYHKQRMIWLGYDFSAVQSAEIGSRYEHSSRRAPIDVFVERMRPVMAQLARVLKPSKLAYLFVGDAVLAGKVIDMREVYADLARGAGLGFLDHREYDLELVSRSFRDTRSAAGNGHRRSKMQRVLLFEGRTQTHGRAILPRVGAVSVPVREPQTLRDLPADGSVLALASDESDRHVHSLIPYPSKFIPEIPRWAIEMFSRPGEHVLDPFAGSGTMAVEALLAGRHATSVDVSPWAALVAQAKTTRVPVRVLRQSASVLGAALESPKRLPDARRLTFELDDFWFDLNHLTEFARIDSFICERLPEVLRTYFRVALASTIRGFSYQDQGQLKVKRDPRKVAAGTPGPGQLLLKRLPNLADRLQRFVERLPAGVSHAVAASSADTWANRRSRRMRRFDLIITSPPYINAMNYAMTCRYELFLLGLVPPDGIKAHQQEYFGTERVYAADFRELHRLPPVWSRADEMNEILRRVYEGEPKRSFIVHDYFVRMRAAFEAILPHLREGGRVVLVTGTNIIKGVPIDTHSFLTSLLEDLGAVREREFHYEIIKQRLKLTRHATASVIPRDGVAVLRWRS